jgi:hypothetical protein
MLEKTARRMVAVHEELERRREVRREREFRDFGGIPALNRNNQPIEIRVVTNLKDTVATDALLGAFRSGLDTPPNRA